MFFWFCGIVFKILGTFPRARVFKAAVIPTTLQEALCNRLIAAAFYQEFEEGNRSETSWKKQMGVLYFWPKFFQLFNMEGLTGAPSKGPWWKCKAKRELGLAGEASVAPDRRQG